MQNSEESPLIAGVKRKREKPVTTISSSPAATPRGAPSRRSAPALAAVLIFAAVLVAYIPSLSGDFLWDDDGHVTRPDLRSTAGLVRIWTDVGATQQYYPLLHAAFWIEHRLWGDSPLGYRMVNLLLHATAAWLFVAVLRRLSVPGALFAGLLFALHPVAVESVAWISEQKNTLSTVLYLAAVLVYLKFDTQRGAGAYAGATGLFVLALLTKTVTATLPGALLVVLWWRRGRLSWPRDVAPLLPWFALGAFAGLFTAWFERTQIGAQGGEFALSAIERGLLAGRVFWFYLGKLLWPADLVFFYPRWEIDAAQAWQFVFPLAGIGLLAGLVWWSRRQRGPLAALLYFGGTLFPVLGFVNVYPFVFSYVADHFQYVACLGILALAAAGAANREWCRRLRAPQWLRTALGALVLCVLGTLTWRQSRMYIDSVTLYRTTLERNPDSWVAHHNLAVELARVGRPHEALPHARRALELKPDFPEALNNLGDNLSRAGRPQEAIPYLERALHQQPGYAQAHNTLGTALMTTGRTEEGIRHFRRAVELQPNLAQAHYNLGLALAEHDRMEEALAHFRETVRLQPTHAEAELRWAIVLALTGRFDAAVPHFERALELAPGSADLRQAYGRALMNAGRMEDAVGQFRDALRRDPGRSGAHHDLAEALRRLGRSEEADYHAREAATR